MTLPSVQVTVVEERDKGVVVLEDQEAPVPLVGDVVRAIVERRELTDHDDQWIEVARP